MRPELIVAGGQTGADRGGLNAAIALGIPHGGWCPEGRIAEDGRIPEIYKLEETKGHRDYPWRTQRNVLSSDAIFIFHRGRVGRGSELTRKYAMLHDRPFRMFDLRQPKREVLTEIGDLLLGLQWDCRLVKTLMIAGSRESQAPGIESEVRLLLMEALK